MTELSAAGGSCIPISHPQILHVNHPIIHHKLSILRDRRTKPQQFRQILKDLVGFLGIKSTEDLELRFTKQLESPISPFQGVEIRSNIGLFPVLRAGSTLLDGMLELIPQAAVYHLGLFRDKGTLLPIEYYNKLPSTCNTDIGYVLDPMIATAGTAIAAVNMLKDWGLKNIRFLCIVASRQGLDHLIRTHPDIQVYVCAIEDELTENGYLIPGLGDAGDRSYNTAH